MPAPALAQDDTSARAGAAHTSDKADSAAGRTTAGRRKRGKRDTAREVTRDRAFSKPPDGRGARAPFADPLGDGPQHVSVVQHGIVPAGGRNELVRRTEPSGRPHDRIVAPTDGKVRHAAGDLGPKPLEHGAARLD